MELERMSDFFAKRIDTYDKHMINNVEGCKNGYIKLAELIPDTARKLRYRTGAREDIPKVSRHLSDGC